MNYDANCVYYTSHIFDAVILLWWGIYGFVWIGAAYAWPYIIYLIFALLLACLGIFSIVQCFTKNTSAPNRAQLYLKLRLWAIIGYFIAAIILLILWIIFGAVYLKEYFAWVIGPAFATVLPLVVDGCVLHGYHKNFGGAGTFAELKAGGNVQS